VLGPLVPNMMLSARHHMTLLVRPPECPRRRHRPTQDTSALAVKSSRETHTTCLSLGGCFVGVDVFFSEIVVYMTVVYICTLFSHLWFKI
jgi:hypothetical protein